MSQVLCESGVVVAPLSCEFVWDEETQKGMWPVGVIVLLVIHGQDLGLEQCLAGLDGQQLVVESAGD